MTPPCSPLLSAFSAERFHIVIVKGSLLLADSLRCAALEAYPDAKITLCQTGTAALAAMQNNAVHLGLFGLTLPDIDGLDLLAHVAVERRVGRLLIVSCRRDERARYCLRAARIGGFFDSSRDDPAALPAAIRRVGDGGNHFGATWRSPTPGERGPPLHSLLTPAELRVFAVIGDGSDDGQAAVQLSLSANTVHRHRQNVMHKIGVQTRAELIRVAIQRGFVRFVEDRVLRPGFDGVPSAPIAGSIGDQLKTGDLKSLRANTHSVREDPVLSEVSGH